MNFQFDNDPDFQFTIFTYFQFTIFKDFQFDNNMDFYSISTYLNLSWLRIFKLTLIRTPDFYFYHFFQNSNFSWTSQTQTSPNDVIFCQSRCSGLDQQSSGTCIKNLLFGASHFFLEKQPKYNFIFLLFSHSFCVRHCWNIRRAAKHSVSKSWKRVSFWISNPNGIWSCWIVNF